MKKIILIIILLFGLFSITGCNKKEDDPSKEFKNPKTIILDTEQGKTKISYDDDGGYVEDQTDDGSTQMLKKADSNFRMTFAYSKLTTEKANLRETNFIKNENYKVISDLEYHGYSGFVIINKKYGTSELFLFINKNKDIILTVKVYPMKSSIALEEMEKAKNPEDVLFNKKEVQQILSTIRYIK